MTFKFSKIFFAYDLSYNSVDAIVTLKEIKINRANGKESINDTEQNAQCLRHCDKPKISSLTYRH